MTTNDEKIVLRINKGLLEKKKRGRKRKSEITLNNDNSFDNYKTNPSFRYNSFISTQNVIHDSNFSHFNSESIDHNKIISNSCSKCGNHKNGYCSNCPELKPSLKAPVFMTKRSKIETNIQNNHKLNNHENIEQYLNPDIVISKLNSIIASIPPSLHLSSSFSNQIEAHFSVLYSQNIFNIVRHIISLRQEGVQKLMRPVVQKLINHPKNFDIFNKPVDYINLGLTDYLIKIKQPMDLGTVKSKLLRGDYEKLDQIKDDVSLVFNNAMTYNPPTHSVHMYAKAIIEEYLQEISTVVERNNKEVIYSIL